MHPATQTSRAPEDKAAPPEEADPTAEDGASVALEIRDAFEDFMGAFTAFKAANDDRLKALEQRKADPLAEDKLQRIEAWMAQHEQALQKGLARINRPPIGSQPDESKAALDAYVRKGETAGFETLKTKGMSVGSEADGGFLVPPQTEHELLSSLREDSPIRALAASITISSSVYKRPFVVSGAAAGWVAETGARTETQSPQLAELAFPAMELYACPAVTKRLLEDSAVNIEKWLTDEMTQAFGEQETRAFVTGDGVAMPSGLLSYPQEPVQSAGHGQIGTVSTGLDGGFDDTAPADGLIELVHALGAKYRRNGTFLMNRRTLSAVRRIRNADGDYLWQPDLGATMQTRLLGFPVVECEDMPDIAPGAPAIAFGNFRRGYLIVDRKGVMVLRDPFSAKPYVLFYATKRVGGGVTDYNAIRLLTFEA